MVTAVGDGAKAATALEKYAAAMQEKTGLRPRKPEIKETKAASGGEAARGDIPAAGNAAA